MQLLKENVQERSLKFFMDQIGKLDAQTQADIKEGKKVLKTADFYIRKKLSGGAGIIDLIEQTDNYSDGVTNIDKAKLAPGQHLGLTSIGMSYGFDPNPAHINADAVDYSSNIYHIDDAVPAASMATAPVPTRRIPQAIVNSTFFLSAGDADLVRLRTRIFFSESKYGLGIESNDEYAVQLNVPKLIQAEKLITARIKFSQNPAALAAGSHFLELRFGGVYVADRQ